MRIFLADLVHDYHLSNNIPVPLGIGLIGSNLVEAFPGQVEVSLFKSAGQMLEAFETGPAPHMVGLSNYSWNVELNRFMIGRIKARFPEVVIFSGGPQIRNDHAGIGTHFDAYPELDFYCMHNAEIPLRNAVEHFLNKGLSKDSLQSIPEEIRGIAYRRDGQVLYTPQDWKQGDFDLDALPSPYLNGMLDRFIDNPRWGPMIESSRGCPFQCTFCAWGVAAKNLVRKFPLQRVMDEIDYLSERSDSTAWTLVDANFGMLERDVEIAEALRRAMDKSDTFCRVRLNWAKNSSRFTTKIAKILGDASEPMVAVQSLDNSVLDKVKRGNIRAESLKSLQEEFENDGRETRTDVLVGLPGESLASHFDTLRGVFDHGFMGINLNQIRLLPGTEMEADDSREEFGLVTKFRMIADTWGIYDGDLVVESEESLVATAELSFDEMMFLRKVHFLIWALWNSRMAHPILRWMHKEQGVNPLDTVLNICDPEPGSTLDQLLKDYEKEARAEWYDSPEAVSVAYADRIEELKSGEFTKQNLKYLAKILLDRDLATKVLEQIAACAKSPIADELVKFSIDRLFDFNKPKLEQSISYSPDLADALRSSYPSIPEGTSECSFSMEERTFRSIKNDLIKFDFETKPVWALSVTLQAYSNSFAYNFQFKSA